MKAASSGSGSTGLICKFVLFFSLVVFFAVTVPSGTVASGPADLQTAGQSDGTDNLSVHKAAHPLSEMFEEDAAPKKSKDTFVPQEILIRLKSAASEAAEQMMPDGISEKNGLKAQTGRKDLDDLLTRFAVKKFKKAFRHAKSKKDKPAKFKNRTAEKAWNARERLARWHRVKVSPDQDIEEALEAFKQNADVESAEPIYEWKLTDDIEPPVEGLPTALTDPDFDQQWHHTAAKVQSAWNYLNTNGVYPGGTHDIVVAVIDTGVDYTHEELVGNMWVNPAEIPGNEIDDDGNGFVDDIHGCSVVSDGRSHMGDPVDLYGHGTHVAGIVAAQAYNQLGGTGVAFNVQVMAVRAAQYCGILTTTDIAEGILYAVDNGAEVINMSFGGYQSSLIVQDALDVALNQAVLVAAAGNDGLPICMYPAAYPWVLGIAASTPTDKRAWFSNVGDLMAPGESIYSTLPGNKYAAWSGTSMATPVVSGIAALMRTFFWQREIYSSRFLMGSILASGPVVDAYKALTEPPTPGVTVYQNWLFDDKGIDAGNDADGRIDSGETVHLAIELINRSGQAENVTATLRAHAQGAAMDDPYVTIDNAPASFGDIGPFAFADNGFIYDEEGVIVGVESPFVVTVAPDCPNDHVIPFEMTITFEDGWNPENPGPFTRISRFTYIVQRGKNIPSVISEDTELTADEYWMVGGPVLIEPQATLTIEPGTQVQWGSISDDPYNTGPQTGYILVRGHLIAQGTEDNPILFFPSYMVSGQTVEITVEEGGTADLSYTKVRNPKVNGFNTIDHCYFDQEYLTPVIQAKEIGYSIFHKLRPSGTLAAEVFDTCVFSAGWTMPPNCVSLYNNVFLQDNENNHALSLTPQWTSDTADLAGGDFWHVREINGETWALFSNQWPQVKASETLANFFGGHVLCIADADDQADFESYLTPAVCMGNSLRYGIGLYRKGFPRTWAWIDGTPLTYTNWASGQPDKTVVPPSYCHSHGGEQTAGSDYTTAGCITPDFHWYNYPESDQWSTIYSKAVVLRLPGTWTEAELDAALTSGELLTYLREHHPGYVRYNAFLNKYWDPNINNWLRINAATGTSSYVSFLDNYWGTASTTLIDHAIVDYYDNFTTNRIDYGTPPEQGFASTYPFAERVTINGISVDTVPEIGSGPATFTITFNRDMDTTVQPFVTFGPTIPYTDFQVAPVDDGWVDARTWTGSFWVTPVTGESYHLMRISGAVAADDPWLVAGHDVGRFRFQVKTMGVAAMTLQANGIEGSIELSWQQNDYDLLAGYNLYRSDTADGTFERINNTIIPVGQEAFTDTNVTPAVPVYYKFTVVLTDLSESGFSNVASAAALDTIEPVLVHAPVTQALPAMGLRLTAEVTDNVRVTQVAVHYRALGNTDPYFVLSMVNVSGSDWSATIPGTDVLPPGVEYYITATDGISQVFDGTPACPIPWPWPTSPP